MKERFNKPYAHTQTQPKHYHFIGLDMAYMYTSMIYMQTFCKLIGYRARLSLGFEVSGDVQKEAG